MNTKNITPMAVKDCIVQTTKRFPVTIGFTAAFALFAMTVVWHPDLLTDAAKVDILCYLAEGALLSMTMRLWDERTERQHLWQNIVAHMVLVVIAAVWLQLGFIGQGLAMAHVSLMVSLIVASVFLPFHDEPDDIPACNFGAHLMKLGIIAAMAGSIPTVALSLLISVSFPMFFGIYAHYEDYWSIIIFFLVVLPTLLFLSRIVKGKQMTNHNIRVHEGVDNFFKIILLPIIITYLCILYCYECHIVLAWELPNGGVSYLVAVMMGFFVMVEIYLYFTNHAGDKATTGWFLRRLPLFMLPLLVLMSIGICKRISDYGLTAARLYLATLNVWFYIASFVMLRTKVKRIHWIPVSFCILFVLTSVFPVNYNAIAKEYILKDLNEKAKHRFEVSEDDWSNRVDYLNDYYHLDYYEYKKK